MKRATADFAISWSYIRNPQRALRSAGRRQDLRGRRGSLNQNRRAELQPISLQRLRYSPGSCPAAWRSGRQLGSSQHSLSVGYPVTGLALPAECLNQFTGVNRKFEPNRRNAKPRVPCPRSGKRRSVWAICSASVSGVTSP